MNRSLRALGIGALGLALGLGMAACELDETEVPTRDASTFQQTHMGSLGNSLTAGFQNGGLQAIGQQASFANLVSQVVTGRSLTMPLVGEPGIGSETGLSPLFVDADGDITRVPLPVQDPSQLVDPRILTYPLPYDNLGVPGATTRQILLKESATDDIKPDNPLFDLILRNSGLPATGPAIKHMERLSPEVITLWTGNNEILGGALSGQPQSTDPNAPGFVVPPSVFEDDFVALCDRVEGIGAKMVAVANVPPITSIPYTRFFGTGSIPGVNRWSMEEDLDGDDDDVQLVLLPAPIGDCTQCYLPSCQLLTPPDCRTLPANVTLTESEVELIVDTVEAYNAIILREVQDRGWAYVDINTEFQALPTTVSARPLNVAFPWQVNPVSGVGTQNTGSAFTLDGVHPSERGHVHTANLFLASINATYGTDYEMLDVAAVENVAGFEEAPAKVAAQSIAPITPEGREGLTDMMEMMSARF